MRAGYDGEDTAKPNNKAGNNTTSGRADPY